MSFLKEPVVHFAILGVALFFYFGLVNDSPTDPVAPDQLVVTESDVQQLVSEYSVLWRRPPTGEELTALIDSQITEEVLVRQALAMGLDANDAVIRNRLRQKMQFLLESAGQSLDPTEVDLQEFLDANSNRFRNDGRVAFLQVLLPEEASGDDITAMQALLEDGATPDQIGQRTLLPPALPLTQLSKINGIFGGAFAESLENADMDVWTGPVTSGYGQHLVRVTEREDASMPDLSEVRDWVLMEWKQTKARDLADAQVQKLLDGYVVERPDDAALDRVLTQ